MTKQISTADLNQILSSLEAMLLKNLKGEKILLTGATGFFGKWMTQILLAASDRFQLRICMTILTRNKSAALNNCPWLRGRADVEFIESDIRNWNPNSSKKVYDSVIHGAATASRSLNENSPNEMFDTIVEGTKKALEASRHSKRFLFISSGAVYGPQRDVENLSEDAAFRPDVNSAYMNAKREAEILCQAATTTCEMKIARCFAFLGPYLPLETHFAAGNFTAKALARKPIEIGGDGTPLRSYLYPTDLMTWLFTILLNAKSNSVYNVGSDQAISILELAQKFAVSDQTAVPLEIKIAKAADPSKPRERYVPSIEKARRELGLEIQVPLDEAIRRTLAWYRS